MIWLIFTAWGVFMCILIYACCKLNRNSEAEWERKQMAKYYKRTGRTPADDLRRDIEYRRNAARAKENLIKVFTEYYESKRA